MSGQANLPPNTTAVLDCYFEILLSVKFDVELPKAVSPIMSRRIGMDVSATNPHRKAEKTPRKANPKKAQTPENKLGLKGKSGTIIKFGSSDKYFMVTFDLGALFE